MKVVFKVALVSAVAAVVLAASLALGARPAAAEKRYFTRKGVLKSFFPNSKRVTWFRFTPTADQKRRLERRLGYALARPSYVFYVAKSGDHIDGYAFIGDELGQHQPITFAVKLTPSGVVQRQEIMVYREPRGDEVRDSRFRAQFKGKTVSDPIAATVDIDCISGATISSHAIAVGVRRALVLFHETRRTPIQVSQASH